MAYGVWRMAYAYDNEDYGSVDGCSAKNLHNRQESPINHDAILFRAEAEAGLRSSAFMPPACCPSCR